MHLEVGEGERKPLRTNVRAVWEPRVRLFGVGPEPQPPELAAELIAQVAVTASPGA